MTSAELSLRASAIAHQEIGANFNGDCLAANGRCGWSADKVEQQRSTTMISTEQRAFTDELTKKFYAQFDSMGFGGKFTADLYSGWSDKFEHDNLNMRNGYQHPVKIAIVASKYILDKSARILDLCAGTGLGGQALKNLGFENIDALDGSAGMLAKAREKGIYRNIFEEIVGEEKLQCVDSGVYDAIVTSGSFVPGHLGPKQLPVIAELLKSGGHFCMAMRAAYLENEFLKDLEPEMDRLEREGVWTILVKEKMEQYHNHLDGRCYVIRKR